MDEVEAPEYLQSALIGKRCIYLPTGDAGNIDEVMNFPLGGYMLYSAHLDKGGSALGDPDDFKIQFPSNGESNESSN